MPTLLCHPIEIADPNQPTLSVGQRLTSIMWKNTSAGFRAISLPTDCALEYCGSILMGEFELLCFVFIKSGTPIKPDFSEEYASSYYGRIPAERWFVQTPQTHGELFKQKKSLF